MSKKLVIIPGITGRMGQEYFLKFKKSKEYEVVGLSTKKSREKYIYSCNLENKKDIGFFLKKVRLENYKEIIVIHCVGKFKFEGEKSLKELRSKNYLDKEIYNSNFITFKNLAEGLLKIKKENQKVVFCAFGSISDRYTIPWWISYSKSKNILRKYMRDIVGGNIRCVFVNVSSTEKEEERPFADKTFWLSCKEVVEKSFTSIINRKLIFQEIDIIKINPNYSKTYYTNYKKIKKIWMHDLYGDVLKLNNENS